MFKLLHINYLHWLYPYEQQFALRNSKIFNKYKLLFYLFITSCGAAAQRGLWLPHSRGFRDQTYDAPQSVGLLWTSDQSVAETST
jgi:hypothetical protein